MHVEAIQHESPSFYRAQIMESQQGHGVTAELDVISITWCLSFFLREAWGRRSFMGLTV